MNRLHAIVRRVHCTHTHHRFAMDALPVVGTDAGKRLVPWLQRYYANYLQGAVAPDVRFRDFHNHILHVNDGYWGGAPRVAHQWYSRLQKHLRAEQFREAAFAAGVLSHYVTDVVQPLHTASSDREALVHRPLEFSIEQSYDRIHRLWTDTDLDVSIQLSDRPEWLGSMMMHSARFAGKRFHTLARRYQFQSGVNDPTEGLDAESMNLLSELFGLAITAWARVIERAAEEAESYNECPIPKSRIHSSLPLAICTAPLSLWQRKVQFAKEYTAVTDLADEYYRSGRLVKHLPAEVDIKRRVIDVYHREKAYREKQTRTRAA